MSWSDRRNFLGFGAAALLSGCGFQPVFRDGGDASRVRGQIAVENISGRLGFEMRRRLTERLGHSDAAPFRLSVSVFQSTAQLAITPTAEITRFNITGFATFVLARADGSTASTATMRAFSAYSANDAAIATRAAERDAELRLAGALADQIATRLLANAGDWLP